MAYGILSAPADVSEQIWLELFGKKLAKKRKSIGQGG